MMALELPGDSEKHVHLIGTLFSFLDRKWHASLLWYRQAQETSKLSHSISCPSAAWSIRRKERGGRGRLSLWW